MNRQESTLHNVHQLSLHRLSDAALLDKFERIARDHHRSTAVLLIHLAAVDARRLYAERSHSSMFGYCTTELGMTRHAASHRQAQARAAPHGRRGSTDAHNLRLRCKAHNRLDADRDYGRDNMNRAVAEARRRPPSVNSHNPAPADVTALVSERVVDPPQVEMFGPR